MNGGSSVVLFGNSLSSPSKFVNITKSHCVLESQGNTVIQLYVANIFSRQDKDLEK